MKHPNHHHPVQGAHSLTLKTRGAPLMEKFVTAIACLWVYMYWVSSYFRFRFDEKKKSQNVKQNRNCEEFAQRKKTAAIEKRQTVENIAVS